LAHSAATWAATYVSAQGQGPFSSIFNFLLFIQEKKKKEKHVSFM